VTAGALAFLTLALTIPAIREVFRFAPVLIPEIAICVSGALLSILISESLKVSPLRELLERMGR
jgi:hypothetical protein